MSDNRTPVAVFLRRVRERAGKSQKEIAEELGLSGGVVSQWETGYRKVPRARIHEVAVTYGMTGKEKHEFVDLPNNPKLDYQSPSEYRVFYELIMLPKKARERVIRAMKAYESVPEK